MATKNVTTSLLTRRETLGLIGAVGVTTIYPGWYAGRTIHIHFKVRTFSAAGQNTFEFTSQLFIDDAINDVVLACVSACNVDPQTGVIGVQN